MRNHRSAWPIIVMIFLVCASSVASSQNPFIAPTGESVERPPEKTYDHENSMEVEEKEISLSPVGYILYRIKRLQGKLNSRMAGLFNDMKEGRTSHALFLILLFSFLYGALHAAGPGHGKAMIGSYFLSRSSRITEGILAGSIISAVHALSTLIVIGLLYFVMRRAFLSSFETMSRNIQVGSAVLIIAIGVYLLFSAIHEQFIRKNHEESMVPEKEICKKNLFLVCISIGIIPCPGATIILLFAINKGILPAGILSVIAMSIGMAMTISVVAVMIILTKRHVAKFTETKGRFSRVFEISMQLLGSLFIIILGIFLLIPVISDPG